MAETEIKQEPKTLSNKIEVLTKKNQKLAVFGEAEIIVRQESIKIEASTSKFLKMFVEVPDQTKPITRHCVKGKWTAASADSGIVELEVEKEVASYGTETRDGKEVTELHSAVPFVTLGLKSMADTKDARVLMTGNVLLAQFTQPGDISTKQPLIVLACEQLAQGMVSKTVLEPIGKLLDPAQFQANDERTTSEYKIKIETVANSKMTAKLNSMNETRNGLGNEVFKGQQEMQAYADDILTKLKLGEQASMQTLNEFKAKIGQEATLIDAQLERQSQMDSIAGEMTKIEGEARQATETALEQILATISTFSAQVTEVGAEAAMQG